MLIIGQVAVRQGDVPLIIAKLPASAKALPSENCKAILAYGEVTGHHHRFHGGATLYADGDDRYVRVHDDAIATISATAVEEFDANSIRVHDADGTIVRMPAERMAEIREAIASAGTLSYPGSLLRHEEHDAIVVPPGVYQSPGQREYTSADMAPIRVAD